MVGHTIFNDANFCDTLWQSYFLCHFNIGDISVRGWLQLGKDILGSCNLVWAIIGKVLKACLGSVVKMLGH